MDLNWFEEKNVTQYDSLPFGGSRWCILVHCRGWCHQELFICKKMFL